MGEIQVVLWKRYWKHVQLKNILYQNMYKVPKSVKKMMEH